MNWCFWRICLGVLCLLELARTAILRKSNLFPLDIIHYNDFHDRFGETSPAYPICPTNYTNCIGGFPRLYHEVKTLLHEKPDALLLDAGDTFQGTYWYTLLKWNIAQRFINMLPHDAYALGNHEFDDGIEGIAPYMKALQAPVLVANINTTLEPSLNGLYKPHIVVERKGRKIGIIGLITIDTKRSSRPAKVEFLDPIEVTKKEAQLLKDQGIDIIIVLSHCGIAIDKMIAEDVGENIDIIVGGHSHSLLWNGDLPEDRTEEIAGPYPVIMTSKTNPDHKVLVVTASAFSKYVGKLTAYFDTEGELVSFSGDPVYLNRSIPEDPEIKALLKPYADNLNRIVSEVVGHADDNLLFASCASSECAIGNIIADSFLNAERVPKTQSTICFHGNNHGNISLWQEHTRVIFSPANKMKSSELPAVAFFIKNMIRGSISKGDVTVGAIINTMPFTNKVMTFVLSGRHLISALERGVSMFWHEKSVFGPWMPQVAGMQLTVNTTSRSLISVLVKQGDSYQPLQLEQDYQVTTPDFLTIGGAGFKMLNDNKQDEKLVGVDYKVFKDYISLISPISDKLDNRITVIA